jgi:hypothetical protein
MKKFIPFAIAAALALGGCAAGGGGAMPSNHAATAQDATTAIKAAENELKMAAAKFYAWRDTGKIIKKAKAAAKAGKYDEAVKLADKATRQSQNALAQYEQQKNAGPRL